MAENLWYVVRVRIGAEDNVKQRCLEQISPEILKECYVFHYEENRNICGECVVREKVLFPGYIFLVTDSVKNKKLEWELWHMKGAIGLLEMEDGLAVLCDEEVDFLVAVSGYKQTIELSEGIIEQSMVKVYSGPLVGQEKYIRKIDRHKKKAFLEVPMSGKVRKMQMGLEIVMKS